MYKVGDEVFIKGEVVEVVNDVPYPVRVRLGSDNGGIVFTNDELCYSDKIVKTYEMGLNDAWNLLKKVYDMKCDAIEEIFGVECGFYNVIRNFTFEDCRDKIEAYEKEKEIKVNDIVKVKDERGLGIVTAVCPTGVVYVLWNDGGCGDYEPCELETTGRTAEGLDLLLRQIAE